MTAGQGSGGRSLRLQLLGPLRLWHGEIELDPGPRQQAALLAVLLARADHPMSRAELISLLWEDVPPASAANVIHKYVGALRRVLEPELSARQAGRYLQRRGDGYLFDSRTSGLDLVAFRELLTAAREAGGRGQPQKALDDSVAALNLWRGAAGDGIGLGPRAVPVFAALNNEFLETCVATADLAVQVGQPGRVVPALELATTIAPLDERVQAARVVVLGAAGRTADALAAWQTIRGRLADELGVDPCPALRDAHARVLTQTAPPVDVSDGEPSAVGRSANGAHSLVGRKEELATFDGVVRAALDGGTSIAVLDGEPGIGKTRLLREVTARAERSGARPIWGMCLEGEGTPSMWLWIKLVRAMIQTLPPESRDECLAGDIGLLLMSPTKGDTSAATDSGAQFRLFEQVVALVDRVAADRPLVLVIDDLQWADVASLELLSHLAIQLPARVAIVAALRDRAPTPGTELSRHLAKLSRNTNYHRLHLDALTQQEVAEIVRREIGREPAADEVGDIYARTTGNPFFVRELSRLLSETGAFGLHPGDTDGDVPATVLDVVRARTADLSDDARQLLHVAALVGRDVSVALLAHASGTDVATCLGRIEELTASGLLESTPGEPFAYRFQHDLVRESVIGVMGSKASAAWHLRIANALETVSVHDDSAAERLAYHLNSAGPLVEPTRTTTALIRAADRAAAKCAFDAAERHLRSSMETARTAGLPEVELSAVMRAVNVLWTQGFSGSRAELLTRGEHLAGSLHQDANLADLMRMRAMNALTQLRPDSRLLMQRLIDECAASADPVARTHARNTQALQQWLTGDVGAALRYLDAGDSKESDFVTWQVDDPFRSFCRIFGPLFRGLVLAMAGRVQSAQSLFRRVESATANDPYALTTWAYWAAFAAEWAGDPVWALAVTEKWAAADRHQRFGVFGPYLQISQSWARALTGRAPAAEARRAESVVRAMLDQPRFGMTRDFALVAEMFVAAGMPDEAAAALGEADRLADLYAEPFAEPLRLLIGAEVLRARGETVDVVRAAVARAKARASALGAHVIVQRADQLSCVRDSGVTRLS